MIHPDEEKTVWQGTPSPLLNLPLVIVCFLLAALATAGLLAVRGSLGRGLSADTEQAAGSLVPWLIAGVWIACGLVALIAHLKTTTTKYHLTSERLRITTGLFSTATEEVELRRVRDSSVSKPFLLRLLGLGNVHVVSADLSAPRLTLQGVHDPDGLQAKVRALTEGLIRRHGVREIDVM